ncbi:PREDICTED: uncharacterized protein LOC101622625, partial [Condylura cristata]|uniref:uncharacterized protein LOC101622625 n=1 Tax=Condylura cristata TaxID=143302 RepID=UPI0006437E1D
MDKMGLYGLILGTVMLSSSDGAWRKAQLYADLHPLLDGPDPRLQIPSLLTHVTINPCAARQVPHRVGVFLDYAHGDVSFYDMAEGSHIFSFPSESFSGTLLPFFFCHSGDVSMTLCPLEAGPQKPSVPMNKTSLGELVSPPEIFQVLAPSDPIVAAMGEDITLSCFLDPAMSAENMEVRLFRSNIWESVLIYQDRQEQNEQLMAQYAGRTSLMREFLSEGEASVTIHKVKVADNGLYTCFFSNGVFSDQARLELQVAGVGSVPQVYITGPEEDGVHVVCTASGWFPEPQVQWRDLRGEQLLGFSQAQAQDPEGLFRVEAALVVRDSAAGNVTCTIHNPILRQEKAMAMVIPEPFFPRVSPWKPALLVILPLLLLLLLGAACCTWREHSRMMQELQGQRTLHLAKEEDRQAREEALKDTAQRKAAYLVGWRKAQLYADWRKERFQAYPFLVIAPPYPIVAELGEDATLSCSLDPAMSAEDMEVRWFRSHIWESVFTYQDRQERHEEQMAQYAGRTSLLGESLSEGKAAVRIHKVQAADNGLYTCSFRDGDVHEEATMELQVAEPFFPRVSPWQSAVLVSLPLLLLLLLGSAYCTWREHSRMMRELGELRELQWLRICGFLRFDIENDRQIMEEALKDTTQRKAAYLAGWRKAQLYA